MAYTYTTEGIILKRWNYKDQDKMVRVLTRKYGKLTTRAISARKVTSKLAGHLEPFIYADFFFAKSKTIDIVAGSNTIAAHTSLPHSATAAYFADIVDYFIRDNQEDVPLFVFVHDFLSWLNTAQPNLLA